MTDQKFSFHEGKHQYRLGNLVLPSVTQVLPEKFIGVPPELVAAAAYRGQIVHNFTEDWDLLGRYRSKPTMEIAPFLAAYQLFLKEMKPEIIAVEKRGWCKRYLYAGTSDRIYRWGGYNSLVDIKTPAVIYPEAALQTAAYEPICGYPIKKRFTLQLKIDGTYKLQQWKDRTDFSMFLSYLNCYRWKQRHYPKHDETHKLELPDV